MQFPHTSRYYGIEIESINAPNGKTKRYLRRRFLPHPASFTVLQEHTVVEKELLRLDNISAQYLSDPEQFWRICDANLCMHPDDLTQEAGQRIRIALPEGIPGKINV